MSMLKITPQIILPETEIVFTFTQSTGPGGQNVNKVATAALLRFNINHSESLNAEVKTRIHHLFANKINAAGELIIKANRFRSQERNKADALQRLVDIIKIAATKPRKRKPTKPSRNAVEKRLQDKKHQAKIKAIRTKKDY